MIIKKNLRYIPPCFGVCLSVYRFLYSITTVTPFIISSYEGSNSGYAIKPKKDSKTTSRHRNTVEYIAGKSFLFIPLKEKLDLTLFSVRRSQYFIPHTKSIENPGLSVYRKWKLNKRENLACFVLFLSLLWCEVKWKLFYDAKATFKSTL